MRAILLASLVLGACGSGGDDVDVSPVGEWTLRIDVDDLGDCVPDDDFRDKALPFDIIETADGITGQTRPNSPSDPNVVPIPAAFVEVTGARTRVYFELEATWDIDLWPAEPRATVNWTTTETGCQIEAPAAVVLGPGLDA